MKIKAPLQLTGLVIALAMLFAASSVWAHGLATTQAKQVGPYTIEFEYNSLSNVRAGEYTLYLAYLLDTETQAGQDYDSATVRIEKQNGPGVISGNLKGSDQGLGFSSISGTIPEPGMYTARVSFYKDGKSLGAADFNFQVDKKKENFPWIFMVLGTGIFLVGFAVGWLLKRFRKKHNSHA